MSEKTANEIILIIGEFDSDKVTEVFENLLETDLTQPIDIYINSTGGDLNYGSGLIEHLLFLKGNGVIINTYALGVCSSMGAMIFLLGTNRLMGKFCHLMLHNYLEGGSCELEHSAIARAGSAAADTWFSSIVHEVFKDTNIDAKYAYKKWDCTKTINWVVRSEEAIKLKIATEIY